jgi:hypothetical protein
VQGTTGVIDAASATCPNRDWINVHPGFQVLRHGDDVMPRVPAHRQANGARSCRLNIQCDGRSWVFRAADREQLRELAVSAPALSTARALTR